MCTLNKKGRLIERSEFQSYVDQNKKNIAADTKTYKKRQAIIEHTYGIIKRQWGFYYITTKRGIKRASADVGLMFAALNLRRIINLIDKNEFTKFLRELCTLYFSFIKSLQVAFWPSRTNSFFTHQIPLLFLASAKTN